MVAFKSFLHSYLASTTQLAPYTGETILPVLKTSAKAAVAQCTGGDSKRDCGFYWSEGEFLERETSGAGEQMGVLAAVQNLLVEGASAPGTESTQGGGSNGGGSGGQQGGAGKEDGEKKSMATRAEMNALVAVLAGVGMYVLL